ncbi:MAG TPA: DUF6259 domain-containing protein [Verrucomicrobiae bacterium]|nr:DUF6259 domain-containing protein [Verrucomicrobiae bacterium]
MNEFRFFFRIAWCIGLLTMVSTAPFAFSSEVTLEDQSLLVGFDSDSGALTRFENKATHWTIERRPELGVSVRMFAPLPDRRYNPIFGQKQHAASVEKLSDHEVRLVWKNLVSENGGALPITFVATVTLTNGAVTFDGTLINDSPLSVETIDYPYFGDLNPPGRNAPMRVSSEAYGGMSSDEIYPHFANDKGYWGVDFPTKTTDSKTFYLIQSQRQGLYIERHNPDAPYLLECTFEQHPGLVDSINDNVPLDGQLGDVPSHLEFRMTHFVFAHPHSTINLMPIVLRCYKGDWHAGADLYKQWRATWFKAPHLPDWIKNVNSWQQIRVNSPEQDYLVPFTNLVTYGEECASNGVGAIQVVGWNRGGQDGGDPSLEPDPGLGTWQELHDAISQVQAKGVKIILFGKPNWADETSDWYKNELYKYAATDPYGIPYQQDGFSYVTPTQLARINNHHKVAMDILCPAYQDVVLGQFNKLLSLGSAGFLWDGVLSHGLAAYNFATNHGYAAPRYVYSGDIPLARRLRAAADQASPDFLFCGEAPQDWLMQYYPLSYFRIRGNSEPIERYIDSQAPLMVAVTGFDDREMLNRCLLDRYIISYEPRYFKGHLNDFPLTLAYGRKIDALRRRYADYIWNADFRDTLGARVNADGPFRYSVFVAASGKRAVIVVNEDSEKSITADVDLPQAGKLMACSPEQPDGQSTDGTLNIPARSAAVVLEQ